VRELHPRLRDELGHARSVRGAPAHPHG
jgi:hypothetical protein